MDFDAFYTDLEGELQKLVRKNFKKYRAAAQKDVEEYLRLSRGRLQDYSRLVSLKKITKEEQEFLIQALKQNALLYSLKESGRASLAMKRFAESVVSVTLEVALAYAIKSI
ncbi:MAG: hypothetical protein PHS30_00295 [Bacteroidales bacterium]|nr:hypothetical protein [Bacteroidales bacterium]